MEGPHHGGTRMRSMTAVLTCGAAVVVSLASAPQAGAAFCDPLPNGRFTATSDGVWAKTNDVFHDEATVTSTWTITSSCTGEPLDCADEIGAMQAEVMPERLHAPAPVSPAIWPATSRTRRCGRRSTSSRS